MSQTFFTVDQVADRLGLHPKTVLRLIAAERLRATKIGKSYRILRGDLDAFAGVSPSRALGRCASPRLSICPMPRGIRPPN